MGLITVEELFDGPWGIMADRRAEIEEGSWGARDRIYAEEVEKRFLPIGKAAELLGCHESTARNVLREQDARFIKRGLAFLYYRPDVDEAKALREEKMSQKAKAAA